MTTETTTKQKEYKVQRISIKNFKNIESLDMNLEGKSVFLIGDNALNKSSIIQAIWLALSKKGKPKQPIKQGADKAEILVIIGADGKEYSISLIMQEGKDDKLEITTPDGFKSSKLESLTKITGDINFDIIKFVNLVNTADGRREQVKIVRAYIGDEANAGIDIRNENIKNIEDNRKEINANITRLKKTLEGKNVSDEDREKYKKTVEVADLLRQQKDFQDINARIDNQAREIVHQESTIVTLEKQFNEAKELMERLLATKMEREDKIKGLKDELKNAVRKDAELKAVEELIANSSKHNQRVTEVQQAIKDIDTLAKATEQYKKLDEDRKRLTAEKAEIISNSKLPVQGLTFDEDMLYLNGLPLDETQQSTSELMEVGLKLAIAKDPICRIVQIPRAESLGAKRLEAFKKFIKDNNFQGFYEEVQRGVEDLKIEYVEEV